jgi:3-deoxy-D-manno-octulosonic-acid transferase
MHCASLGEFEQGRPVLEQIKKEFPEYAILVSFFSPSGYEIRKNYEGADYIFYLPSDLPGYAKRFISVVNPSLVLFIKYEFWAGYLHELKTENIPALLVSARFREKQFMFSPIGGWLLNKLKAFSNIYVQDLLSYQLLVKADFKNVAISGDTRFDRVSSNAKKPQQITEIQEWINNRKVLIAGSTWKDDEAVIFPRKNKKLLYIIAPHEIDEKHLKAIEENCGEKSIRYSQLIQNNRHENYDAEILILDTIGILMSLYRSANIAYVGGAFHGLLHNILEPAAMGLPVIFGPKTKKFPEAEALEQAGGGFRINNKEEFENCLEAALQNTDSGRQSLEFVESQVGATAIIMKDIRKLLIQT